MQVLQKRGWEIIISGGMEYFIPIARELLRAPFEYKAQGKAHVRHCFSQRPRKTKEGVASARRSINSHQLWNAPFATLR
jgi:hypothetical protein